MHYYIDGYNLLFYLLGTSAGSLKSQRDWIIQSLNIKTESLGLDLTVVFDSPLSPGEGSRSHFQHLEILYTPEGVSADDFIIYKLAESRDVSKEVVVTNDRELSIRARHQHANAQGIENFINWLDRRYKNKVKKKIKLPQKHPEKSLKLVEKESALTRSPAPKIQFSEPVPRIKLLPLPAPFIPTPLDEPPKAALGSFDYYLSQFESAHEKILLEENAKSHSKKGKVKQAKRKVSLFQEHSPDDTPRLSESERWLEIFQKRDRDKNI